MMMRRCLKGDNHSMQLFTTAVNSIIFPHPFITPTTCRIFAYGKTPTSSCKKSPHSHYIPIVFSSNYSIITAKPIVSLMIIWILPLTTIVKQRKTWLRVRSRKLFIVTNFAEELRLIGGLKRKTKVGGQLLRAIFHNLGDIMNYPSCTLQRRSRYQEAQ